VGIGGIDFTVDLAANDLELTDRPNGAAIVGRLTREDLDPDDVGVHIEGGRGQQGRGERHNHLGTTASVHDSSGQQCLIYRKVCKRTAPTRRFVSPGAGNLRRSRN
jgi:hypothetical protein